MFIYPQTCNGNSRESWKRGFEGYTKYGSCWHSATSGATISTDQSSCLEPSNKLEKHFFFFAILCILFVRLKLNWLILQYCSATTHTSLIQLIKKKKILVWYNSTANYFWGLSGGGPVEGQGDLLKTWNNLCAPIGRVFICIFWQSLMLPDSRKHCLVPLKPCKITEIMNVLELTLYCLLKPWLELLFVAPTPMLAEFTLPHF